MFVQHLPSSSSQPSPPQRTTGPEGRRHPCTSSRSLDREAAPGTSGGGDPAAKRRGTIAAPARQGPFYKRIYNYFRTAITGVAAGEDSELEDLEAPPRYRPDSLRALCRATRFSQSEIKRMYRGFKADCPSGIVREDTFKTIYSQFFPEGANTNQYAHYVFKTLDSDRSGIISFEDFVQNLSILLRGSLDERLRWAFTLYDINGDGHITREEMTDIVTAVYELMGKFTDPNADEGIIKEKVNRIFQRMDQNQDGVVTLDEFLETCRHDDDITSSMHVFDTAM